MPDASLTLWLLVVAVFLLAGLVKGVVGMGLPTVAMGLLSVTLPPAQAATLLLVPSFVTNIWQLAAGPSLALIVRRLWTMMAGILAGTVVGAGFLASGPSHFAQGALGLVLVIYALLGLSKTKFRVPTTLESWLSPLVGAVTGVIAGATGLFIVPAVPYIQALDFERDDLVQALGLSFTVSSIALGIGLYLQNAFATPGAPLGLSLVALAPALAGMTLGQMLRTRMSVATFRLFFFVGMLVLGVYLAVEGLFVSGR